MERWFLDPKSISLIAGVAAQLVITVWHSRQTAVSVAGLVDWRLEMTRDMAALETRVAQQGNEIERLRDAHAGRP